MAPFDLTTFVEESETVPQTTKDTRARRDGRYLTLLGCVAFLLWGLAILGVHRDDSPVDFRIPYSSAKCVLTHRDPYNANDVERVFKQDGGRGPSHQPEIVQYDAHYVYFPTTFVFTILFALMPVYLAQCLWISVLAGSFIVASCLMWDLAADYAPVRSGALLCLLLLNSGSLIASTNTGVIAISFCVIGSWCFLRERAVTLGGIFLALSLALKPHDTGPVWFYFLLAGVPYRKHAIQTLLLYCAMAVPMTMWITQISPHWLGELNSNMAVHYTGGGIDDPSPTAKFVPGTMVMTNLQAMISQLWSDPGVYNTASYLICAPLLVLWVVSSLRKRSNLRRAFYALASISAITMLPLYHRQYDSRLVLLTFPAFALLWSEGGRLGKIAFAVELLGLVAEADFPWAVGVVLIQKFQLGATGILSRICAATEASILPLSLFAVGGFYLWLLARQRSIDESSEQGTALARRTRISREETQILKKHVDAVL